MLPKRGIEPRLTGEGESRPAAKLQAAAMEDKGLGEGAGLTLRRGEE